MSVFDPTPTSRSIADLVRGHSGSGAPAIVASGEQPLTWEALNAFVSCTIADLNARGIGRGMRIASVLPNGPAAATALIALSCATTVAPFNPDYVEGELTFGFRDLDIDAVVVPAGGGDAPRLAAQALGLAVLELHSIPGSAAGTFRLDGPALARPHENGPAQAYDVAFVLHTSGTTARPKIVPLVHGRIAITAANIARVLELSPSDVALNVMPLFHVHGILNVVLSSAVAGGSVVCSKGFDASTFLRDLAAFSPSWYSAVPTIHQGVLAAAERAGPPRPSRLRFIRSSSAPLPGQIASRIEDLFGVPVIESYGMTEVDQITSNPLPPQRRKHGSVGLPGGVEIRIIDEHHEPVTPGATGEIAVRGPNVMPGYENNPAANAEAFADGFFLTGDLGRLDEDGYLFLTGRAKEMINRGGEKIAPREIDEVLHQFPGVAAAASFGEPHRFLGEEVAAAVVAAGGSEIDLVALRRHVAERLAPFKAPKTIRIVDRLPVGPTGKILRRALSAASANASADGQTSAATDDGDATGADSIERRFIAIWEELLGTRPIGPTDSFFTLGGSSLLAQTIFKRIETEFGEPLPLGIVAKAETVRELVTGLRAANWPLSAAPADAVAVIGMAGAYPDAPNLDAFADNLSAGRAATFEALRERPSPNIATLVQIVQSALDDAGLSGGTNTQRTGVWIARDASLGAGAESDQADASPAALLSRSFGWHGPNVDVDTRCSSALVALHAATVALRCGACDVAIVGAVSSERPAQAADWLRGTGALSATGRACALEDDADGWLQGQGVGALVLCRRDDAHRDGRRTWAVVDAVETGDVGSDTKGMLGVDFDARVEIVRRALGRSRFTAASIEHVEVHAVGNRLGDALEIAVFDRAFEGTNGAWSIGAVAASIGHLEAASGMAALHKAILMFARRQLLPTPRRAQPNSALRAARGRFSVSSEARGWSADAGVCVSSVGTSGIAAVAVLGPVTAAPHGSGDPDREQLIRLLHERAQASLSGTQRLERDDHVLRAGLDSIQITRITHDIEHALGADLSPVVLFEHPTLARLADHLRSKHADAARRWLRAEAGGT